jgi:hypothetical protein
MIGHSSKLAAKNLWRIYPLNVAVKICVPRTRDSGTSEGSVMTLPFRCGVGEGGKLRLIVERPR